jgi:hypothetical protein
LDDVEELLAVHEEVVEGLPRIEKVTGEGLDVARKKICSFHEAFKKFVGSILVESGDRKGRFEEILTKLGGLEEKNEFMSVGGGHGPDLAAQNTTEDQRHEDLILQAIATSRIGDFAKVKQICDSLLGDICYDPPTQCLARYMLGKLPILNTGERLESLRRARQIGLTLDGGRVSKALIGDLSKLKQDVDGLVKDLEREARKGIYYQLK